ncbi:MAG: hypothetical protein HKO90_10320 [Flavobacteriaceae bacterium]|nr:hypothetical protein [Flavobacteriaceae bacterium]
MKQFFGILVFGLLSFSSVQAQAKLSDYKYVIVEKQFHFQNEPDEYNLNRMVKYLFNKYGFNAIIEGETLPDDLISNYCLALTSEVKVKGALRTKAMVTLTDCQNNTIYVSPEGITRVKEFDRAYDLSIRKAFENFADLGYRYIPSERVTDMSKSSPASEKSEDSEAEIALLKAEISELKKKEAVKEEVIQEANQEPQLKKGKDVADNTISTAKTPVYYAGEQADSSEIAITDSEGKTVMILLPSGRKDLFLVKDKNAVVYKESGKWFLSETGDGEQLITQIDLKF